MMTSFNEAAGAYPADALVDGEKVEVGGELQ